MQQAEKFSTLLENFYLLRVKYEGFPYLKYVDQLLIA
jgi:hypothetical protein